MRKFGWFCLPLMVSLIACSKSPGPASRDSVQPVASEGTLEQQTSHLQVRCDDAKNCKPEVGLLLGKNSSEVYRCTSFIAGEFEGKTVVATSKLCTEDIADCATDVMVRFPAFAR